jgi:hypothetical protein
MTHQAESTILDTVVTTILDNGFDGLAVAVTMFLMVERLNREINCLAESKNGYTDSLECQP